MASDVAAKACPHYPRGTKTKCQSCGIDHFDHKQDGDAAGYGEKTISFWGSVCLNLNNNTGPAMLLFPLLLQQSGWFIPVLSIFIAFIFSSFACTMLCEAMQRIPGNRNFSHRYEFATLVRHYFGKKWYIVFQVLYNISLQSTNIVAMIISAQAIDQFIEHVAGHSYALDYQQWPFKFIKSSGSSDYPWCTGVINDDKCLHGKELTFVISIGFLVCMAICIPFGYLNLDENMWFQWFSLIGMVAFSLEFIVQFLINLNHEDKLCLPNYNYTHSCNYDKNNHIGNYSQNGIHRTPFYTGSAADSANVLGVAVFSFAYVVTIPSWVNEKRHDVNVNKGIWVPGMMGFVLKTLIGLTGAWAFVLIQPDGSARQNADDLLDILFEGYIPWYTQYSAYLWDLTSLIPGIPVLAIMVRYNLLSGNVCGRIPSFFWGVVAPWIVTAFCYEADILVEFCNWVSLVLLGVVNFIVPVYIYRTSLVVYPDFEDMMGLDSAPVLQREVSERSALLDDVFSGEENEHESSPLLRSTIQDSSRRSSDSKAPRQMKEIVSHANNSSYSSHVRPTTSINHDGGNEGGDESSEVSPRNVTFAIDSDYDEARVSSRLISRESLSSISSETGPHEQEGYVNAVPRYVVLFGRVFTVNRIRFADAMIVFFSVITVANVIIAIYGAAS